ncbi:MAG: sulfatase family protein [Opitutales bacterium]
MARPNILFIVADQHNAKLLGHAGHPQAYTPHLDRMAKEGVRCLNAITPNPVCTPTRVSFTSGQYCHNHGYYGLGGPNPGGLPTIFGHFRAHGYATSAVGKIHCPEYWVEDDVDNFHETCDTSIGGRSAKYAAFLRERGKLHLEDHGSLPEHGDAGHQSMEGRPSPLTFEESQEGWIADETIRFIEENRSAGKPFFAFASLPRPHQCTSPSPEFWERFADIDPVLPPNADYDMAAAGKAPNLIKTSEGWRTGDRAIYHPRTYAAFRERKQRGYLAAIAQIDAAVGRMVDHLRDQGLLKNTVVVYTSDHGDFACEHGVLEKAPGISSDAITRVPMLWLGPDLPTGETREGIINLVDLPATFCGFAGLPPLETFDGKDASAWLRGKGETVNEIGVTEFAWSRSIRKGKYRLIYYPKHQFDETHPDGFGELYDIEADPYEMQNLYFKKKYKDLIREMERDLMDWLVTTTRPKTTIVADKTVTPQSRHRLGATVNADDKVHPDRLEADRRGNYL